jgi:hypothetical protein
VATGEKTETVHRHCVRKLGVHKGALAAARISQYAMVVADFGRLPTNLEYAEWWAVDERTGWRHRALMVEALGEDWQPIVERVAAVIAAKKLRSPRAVQQLALS